MTTETPATQGQIAYQLEYLGTMTATLALPPEVIGPVPQGVRSTVYVTGGTVEGPRLRGRVLPVGGDWLTLYPNGVAALDVRATLESHDGALISVHYTGVIDLGEAGYQAFLAGELPPDGTAIRVAPRFQTAHPEYAWLNRIQAVGIGETVLSQALVRYDLYALR
jgi:hypothetical protein